ncbi:hypothetical protein F4859DRAFT_388674 [Xylaria cf. heliscus]|nr:hypothetical protein F4859DRAFT_388674 [Xylaria cf. heliscus]
MQTNILASIFLFAVFGAAQDVDLDDVPLACQQVCQDITRLSDDCDRNNNNDAAERDCVCNVNNAQQQATNCAACVKANIQNNNGDDADDDLSDLFRACGWNYADVSATSASDTASSTSGVITTTQTFPATTTTEVSSGTTTTETIPATTVTSTRPASSSETESPDNAGSSLSLGFGFIAAGLMAALTVVL